MFVLIFLAVVVHEAHEALAENHPRLWRRVDNAFAFAINKLEGLMIAREA